MVGRKNAIHFYSWEIEGILHLVLYLLVIPLQTKRTQSNDEAVYKNKQIVLQFLKIGKCIISYLLSRKLKLLLKQDLTLKK